MLVDAQTNTISLNISPEDYKFIYKLEADEPERDELLILLSGRLSCVVNRDSFSTSIFDFFTLKSLIEKSTLKFNIQLTQKCLEVCKDYLKQLKEVRLLKEGVYNERVKTTLNTPPYEDQKSAAAFLLARGKAGNFSSVGIGKTLAALCCFNILKDSYKISNGVVFCLNENKLTWYDQLTQHTNYKFIIAGNGTNRVLHDLDSFDQHDLLVIHYDALLNESVKAALIEKRFDFWIVDEAHVLRNVGKTKRANVIFELNEATKPHYVYPLSGTPVAESPANAYALLKLIRPHLIPSKNRFLHHFCNFISIRVKGTRRKIEIVNPKKPYKNLDELQNLLELYSFRKTQDDVRGFPPTVLSIKSLQMEPDQNTLYKRILNETIIDIAKVPDKMLHLDNILAKTTRLRQCTVSPAILGESNVSSIKLKALDEILEEILDDSKAKVVVWSTFRAVLETLVARYVQYGARLFAGINNLLTQEERDLNVREFLTFGGSCRILLATTSCGTGGNWGIARHSIYLDEPLKNIELIQSRGRITRRDAVGTSNIIVLKAVNSIDEWVRKKITQKEDYSRQLVCVDQQIVVKEDGVISKEELLDCLNART